MATEPHRDNDPVIVDQILSPLCWSEYDGKKREFDYNNLERVLKFIKSGGARQGIRRDYSEAVTYALQRLHIPKAEWTVIRALASPYFKIDKATKQRSPLHSEDWEVTVLDRSREIILYHYPSLTRSESLYHSHGFELGSVTTDHEACRFPRLVELHRSKCFEVTYRILSGRSPSPGAE